MFVNHYIIALLLEVYASFLSSSYKPCFERDSLTVFHPNHAWFASHLHSTLIMEQFHVMDAGPSFEDVS